MLAQTLIFLITTLGDLFVFAQLLRFILQYLRVPARNQMTQFVVAVTDFIVRPARRVIPGLWGLDLATLVLAWLTAVVELWLVLQLQGYEIGAAVGVAVVALAALGALHIIRLTLYVVMFAIVLQAVMSWVNPHGPFAPLLAAVTRPILRPFQRLLPTIANVDLSPLFALIACQLLLAVPLVWLEATVKRLL